MDMDLIRKSIEGGAEQFSTSVVRELLDEIEKYKRANIVALKGWKGKSGVDVSGPKFDKFIVTEYRKEKSTGEVKEMKHEVPVENVQYMNGLVQRFAAKKIAYRSLVSEIIRDKGLNCTLDSFNGGHNRSKYYFPLYYYPIKILEQKGVIHYSGGGIIKKHG